MKSTGVIRKVDELGRIVIPVELRRNLSIKEGDGLEIYVDGNCIILKKHTCGCAICGECEKDMFEFGGQLICKKHKEKLKEALRHDLR